MIFVINYLKYIVQIMINFYFNNFCSFNEVFFIVVMFFYFCRNCEDVWVEDDVVRVEVYFGDQQIV